MDNKEINEIEETELSAQDTEPQIEEKSDEVADLNDSEQIDENIDQSNEEDNPDEGENEDSEPSDDLEAESPADDSEVSEENSAEDAEDGNDGCDSGEKEISEGQEPNESIESTEEASEDSAETDESGNIEKKREAFLADLMPDEKEKKQRNFPKAAYAVFSLVFLSIIIVSGLWIFKSYRDFKAFTPSGTVTDFEDGTFVANPLMPPEISGIKRDMGDIEYPPGILDKYKELYALNKETVGWLKIKNTSIDTPVTKGKNNSYYLKNDFYGKYSGYGNAFLDYRAGVETLSTNSVIYGHKTETGLQVFNDLDKYLDYDFYVNNPIIEYGTLYKDYKWKIFAVYISAVESKDDNGYFFYYINPNIKAGKFPGFIDQIKQYSRFFTAIDLNEKDKILQLSTCIYENDMPGKPVNSRLVVAAKLMAEGESEDVDPSLVLDRKDFRRPQVWYDRYGKKNPYAGQPNWKQ